MCLISVDTRGVIEERGKAPSVRVGCYCHVGLKNDLSAEILQSEQSLFENNYSYTCRCL